MPTVRNASVATPGDTPFALPTPPIWLDHAAVITADLEISLDFYVRVVGLQLSAVTSDPRHAHRVSALLCDTDGHEVLELVEIPEMRHTTVPGQGHVRHLAFRLPTRYLFSLRTRLDAHNYPYRHVQGKLHVCDPDGLSLLFREVQ